jgi:rSAM/selenodomain-associated transferase 1
MPGREWIIRSEKNNTLIVFLRAPEPGRVKTRLAGDVGEKKALALYKTFAAATLAAADQWCDASLSGEILLSYYPEDKLDLMQAWLGRDRIYLPQSGADLGRRMTNAMASAFDRGAERVVLVGTDVPLIRNGHLEQAFECLSRKDVVLGPSLDGGYWLIGMNRQRFTPGIFDNIDWGTSSVFSETLVRCRQN